jgi:hypothetical protein
MTAPGGVSPTPINLSPTEHEQIARVFESGPSLFSLLSTIRTRRFGLGYRSETGEEEMQAWSTQRSPSGRRRSISGPKGPISRVAGPGRASEAG